MFVGINHEKLMENDVILAQLFSIEIQIVKVLVKMMKRQKYIGFEIDKHFISSLWLIRSIMYSLLYDICVKMRYLGLFDASNILKRLRINKSRLTLPPKSSDG